MPVYGPNTPSTIVNDTSLGGSGSWVNLSWAAGSDDLRTSCAINSGWTGQTLKTTGFGFAVGDGETVDGFELQLERRGIDDFSNAREIFDAAIRLVMGGTIQTPDKSSGAAWSTSGSGDNIVTYGSPSDLWSGSWLDTDVESSGFGAAVQATNAAALLAYAQIDNVSITVYTSTGGGGGGGPQPVGWF